MCSQCARSARPDDECEYADGGRTRQQILEENIARLESRLRELEDPEESAVVLHNPYATRQAPNTANNQASHSGK